MILKSFEYSEYDGTPENWSINGFNLEKVNLLVGKNATGKSRTLSRINALTAMFTGKPLFYSDMIDTSRFVVEFTDIPNSYSYSLETKKREVFSERLTVTGENGSDVLLDREQGGEGEILYAKNNEKFRFKLPDNRSTVFIKRDAIQHPFLEKLFEWAEGVSYYQFGLERIDSSFLGPTSFQKIDMLIDGGKIKETRNAPALYYAGEKEFGNDFKNKLLHDFCKVDYDLTDIFLGQNPHLAIELEADTYIIMLSVVEADRNAVLYQSQMSQGMFRALSLLIQIEYSICKNIPAILIIDDIGEGLDYDRSTKLINLLIELTEENDNIQLIMSTNDRYVMNKVPFKYWQLIDRKGGECKVYNYQNSKEIFDEFKYTGLNNFDFLATDFINSEWKQK
jgi:energy-coupling factor transporter ATP-binding protein EcfA2